ncbi:MAG TPA: hypothetical protein VH479_02560 [Acidimicrobiales bacterium]
MGVRAGGVAAAVLLLGGFDWSQSGDLVVTPSSGGPGTTVTVSQDVAPVCGTFTVRFDLVVMGEDDASDGHGEVTFQVPSGAGEGTHTIDARCRRGGGGGGSAPFELEPPATSTTHEVPTTQDPGETTTTRTGITEPTTTTTEGDAPPVPQNGEECEAQARQADAHLAYEPERSMVVGKGYEVTAAVSLDEVPTDVTFEGTTTVVTIGGVRCTITAGLTGSDFDISQRSNEEQSFIGTRELVWSWTVRPLHHGDDLELALTFQSKIFDAGHSILGPTTLHEAHIDVHAVEQSLWGRIWDGFSGFLHDQIVASVIAAILVAAILALGPKTYRNVRARYARRPSTGPAPGDSVPPPPE